MKKLFQNGILCLQAGNAAVAAKDLALSADYVPRRPAGMAVGQMVPGLPARSRQPRATASFTDVYLDGSCAAGRG